MTTQVDLNADMGESFGPWQMGSDTELLKIVTSANVACGFHAGDPDVMAHTMRLAVENNVQIGAHPGFPDLQGFGRQRMKMTHASLANMVRYQVGAARAMAHSAGGKLRHLKLHGALANMCAEDSEMARVCYEAALEVQSDLVIFVIAATKQQEAAEGLACNWAGEIFADRAYNDDATLVDRAKPGAVIHEAEVAAARVLAMVQAGALITQSGKEIATRIDTICCHGDTPEAVQIATRVRETLMAAGISVGV